MKKMQNITGFLLALTLLALVGCAGSETTRSTGAYIDDKSISTKVKTQLAADSLTNAMQIQVETYNGVVQLSGFVDNERTVERAEEIAQNVKGVKEVDNALKVR